MASTSFGNSTYWIPWQQFLGGQVTGASIVLDGHGAGDPTSAGSLNSTGVSGLLFGADADTFPVIFTFPAGLNRSLKMEFYLWLHWNATAATGDAVDMSLEYDILRPDSTTLGVLAAAAATDGVTDPTDGTIAWVADDVITRATSVFKFNPVTAGLREADKALLLEFIIDDLDSGGSGPAADEVTLLGCEVVYNIG